jgi:hypothetical protein
VAPKTPPIVVDAVALPIVVKLVPVVLIFVIPRILCVPFAMFVVPSMVFVEPVVPILTPPPFRPIKTAPVVVAPFPIRMSPLLELPFPISIAALLLVSPYKDTDVPAAVPVIVFVITEVSVDAPADKAPETVADPAVSNPETVAVAEDINPVIDADASVEAPADKAPEMVADPAVSNPETVAVAEDTAPVIDIKDADIAEPTRASVVAVPPILNDFVPFPVPMLIVPCCPFPPAILTVVDVAVASCRPILIVPVVKLSAILIPVVGETCIVAPVIVFVETEVRVVAPALIVTKAFVPVQVLFKPKRDTDAVST